MNNVIVLAKVEKKTVSEKGSALNVSMKKLFGEGQNFINVICYDDVKKEVDATVSEGSFVVAEGRLQSRNFEKDGKRKYVTELIANRVVVVDGDNIPSVNTVSLTGRLTRDPDVRYSSESKAVAHYTLAVDKKDGADFIDMTTFGKSAEFIEKYIKKGTKIEITGQISSGSYEKDGEKIYTTGVITNTVNFAESKKSSGGSSSSEPAPESAGSYGAGFDPSSIDDDDLPFN